MSKRWRVEHLERIKRPDDLQEELKEWTDKGYEIFQVLARPDYRTHYWLVMYTEEA